MEVLDEGFIRSFIRMADDGWKQGWHERNGGNLSYRLTPADVNAIEDVLSAIEAQRWESISDEGAALALRDIAGEMFLITAAGSYFRNITLEPERCMGIIEVDDAGLRYRIRWGFADGGRPTSELPTHLLNHSVKKRVSDGRIRVIYHCHPANINALTFVLPHSGAVFTRELWGMISECAMVFPEGVAVVEWMVPGSIDIARASAKKMEHCNVVIWVHHGMFCAGEDFDSAFGLMHTLEKAAEVLVKVRSMSGGCECVSRITDQNLADLADAYDLDLTPAELAL